MSLNIRKNEIFLLMIVECGGMALFGGIIGAVLGVLSIPNVIYEVQEIFKLSASVWTNCLAFKVALCGVLLSVFIGILSAVYPAFKSSKMEPYSAMTEGEM